MELILVLSKILFEICRIHFFQVAQVEGAFGIDAFVDGKEPAVFFGNKGMTAVGTDEADGGRNLFTGNKGLSTDFALELSFAAVIVVDILVGAPQRGHMVSSGIVLPLRLWTGLSGLPSFQR